MPPNKILFKINCDDAWCNHGLYANVSAICRDRDHNSLVLASHLVAMLEVVSKLKV